jgi:hypothetical protein
MLEYIQPLFFVLLFLLTKRWPPLYIYQHHHIGSLTYVVFWNADFFFHQVYYFHSDVDYDLNFIHVHLVARSSSVLFMFIITNNVRLFYDNKNGDNIYSKLWQFTYKTSYQIMLWQHMNGDYKFIWIIIFYFIKHGTIIISFNKNRKLGNNNNNKYKQQQ